MKAALEAWGAGSNLFTTASPRRRTIRTLSLRQCPSRAWCSSALPDRTGASLSTPISLWTSDSPRTELRGKGAAEAGEANLSERQRTGRLKGRRRIRKGAEAPRRRAQEAARQRDRERREKAAAKAEAALDKAEREHAKKAAAIQAEVDALEERSRAEDDRWEKDRERLQAALRRARDGR